MSYQSIINDIIKISGDSNSLKIKDLITYNTSGGKEFRASLFKLIINKKYSDNMSCIFELLQSAFILVDDVMDESDLRRGVECYYLKKGMISLKYAQYLISILGKILSKNKRCNDLRSLYYYIVFYTCLGQILDAMKKSRDEYNISLYNTIAEYKTSWYTFYFPLSAGYIFINKKEPKNLKEYCKIVGIIFQMQDDMLNFYPKDSKKTGNDLEELKLTYFTCKLAEEKSEIVDKYFKTGKVNDEIIKKVKSYFHGFKEEIERLKNKLVKLEEEVDKNVVDFVNEIFEKREDY